MASNLIFIISNLTQEKFKAEKLKRECPEKYFNIRGGLGNSTPYQVIYILLTIVNRQD